jgi:hypothetical protein
MESTRRKNMDWKKAIKKGFLAFLTFIAAYVVTNPSIITNFIPENIAQMTVGSFVAAIIVAGANWIKNRGKNDSFLSK